MAAMDEADILHPTPERIHFHRLTTLLIVGGKEIMRQVFDKIHPPRTLATVLATVKTTIKRSARLTKPQMASLYPPTGATVRSRDFDMTLLFALLRNICSLTAPAKGWDELPDVSDESLEADLARIKYYRNEVYAHVKGRMEVSADEFDHLWIVIRSALLRMVGTNDVHKRIYWKEHIDRLLREPLQPADNLGELVQQLIEWHEAEMEEIRQICRSISNLERNTHSLNTSVEDNSKKINEEHSKTRQSFEKGLEPILDTVRQLVAHEPTRSAPGSSVNADQMGPVHQGNITVNTFHMYNNQTTNKQNLTTSLPALYGANEQPGAPFPGGWNSGNASPPMKSADSNGSPFSEHSSGSDFQENYRRSVTPSGSVNQRFFPNNVTGQIMSSSGSERFLFPETPIPLASGSTVGNTWTWGAKPSFASTPNLPRNENVPNTHFGSTSPAFLPCNSAGGTSSSTWGASANTSPPTHSPILGQSGPSPTHTQPWSAGDTSASGPMVSRSRIPVCSMSTWIPRADAAGRIFTAQSPILQEHDSTSGGARPKTHTYTPVGYVSPSIPRSDVAGQDMFSLTAQSPILLEHDNTSGGARPKTHPYTPVGSASPSIPRSDAAGHDMFSTQSPPLQIRDSTSGGAGSRTYPYNPNSSGSPAFSQSDTTGHAKTSPSRSLSNMYSSRQSSPWQEWDSSLDGARRRGNDDIRRRASGGDLSNITPQCGLPPNSVPSSSVASNQWQDQYSAARVQPSILSNSGRGCSASNDSIPQDAEECGRGYMAIVIRCEDDLPADDANKAIEKIAKAHIRRSTQQGDPSQFQSYLEYNKNLVVIDFQVSGNQCTILVQPLLLNALEELWKDYKRGDLRVIVQESLSTPEVLQGTDCPNLQVEIDEKEYNLCYLTLRSQGKTQRSHTSSFDGGAPAESSNPRIAKSMPDLTSPLSFSGKFTTENAARELYDIVCQNGGSMEIAVALQQLSDESYQTIMDLGQQNVMKKHANLFRMPPNGDIVNAIISVNFCKKSLDSGCTSNCPDLHLCPFQLLGECERTSSDCNRSHDPNDLHTIRVLGNSLRLDQLSTKQRLRILKKLAQDKRSEWKTPCNIVPTVCKFYVKGTCHKGDSCAYLHVCLYWVHEQCKYTDLCKKDHDLESQHNRGILERYGTNGVREYEILKRLQKVNKLRARSATKP